MKTLNDLKYKYNNLDIFGKIIAVNVVVFIINFIFTRLLKFSVVDYFVLPSDVMDFIIQPWSLLSYGFLHNGFFHMAFNMLFLFYLSRAAVNLFRTKMILNVYLLGIICGGMAYLIMANLIPTDFFGAKGILIGASAGVSALLLFVAAYMPDSQIRLFNTFNVKWKHIAMVIVSLDLFRLLLGFNQGGYVAHFGGYILGYIYAVKLQKGNDIGSGFEGLMGRFASLFKPKSRLKTVHRNKTPNPNNNRNNKSELNRLDKQKKIDTILDKISKSGYESLSAKEKEFLFKVGKD
jgi:membrane associated rhomboid family serine protease